jgi:hypothetical protein
MGTLVYKYLPPERIDVIDSLSIRITQPVSLNDPFEYFNLFDFSEFETKNPQNNEILAYTNDQITEELHKSINKSINEKFGVVSFSKNELSNLLWAHYAKNSTGYVIGFNPSDKMFSTKIKNLKSAFNEVKYSETRPKFKIEDLRIDHSFLCRKPIDWKYEEEIRFIDILDTDLTLTIKDEYDQIVYLKQISKEAIKEVIIGNRMNIDNINRIIQIIRNNEIQCDLYKLVLDKYEYKLHKKRFS